MKIQTTKNAETSRAHAVRRRIAVAAVLCLLLPLLAVTVCAESTGATAAPVAALENLMNLLLGIVRVVGAGCALWGIIQLGMSISSHDPSQRVQGLLTLAGGLIIAFAPEILAFLGVSV